MPKYNQKITKKQMLIDESIKIISRYTTKLTLRQIYYRLVTKLIISNTKSEYKYLSRALVDGRLSGAIDWEDMEDKTRDFSMGDRALWDAKEWFDFSLDRFKDAGDDYRFPHWYKQPEYVEVWCEKEALENLFLSQTRKYRVVCGISRGYPSIAWLRDASIRIKDALAHPEHIFEKATIFYFGDFDPTGKDIERNIKDRLQKTFLTDVNVECVAITPAQIKKYKIPSIMTKTSDARAKAHIQKYGAVSSVELDALEPDVLEKMIADSILSKFDDSIPPTFEEEEEELRGDIRELVNASLVDGGE